MENWSKCTETRTWKTEYKGHLLIVCSGGSKSPNAGLAVCVVTLAFCEKMEMRHEKSAKCKVYPRAWAWELDDHRKLSRKFKVKGQLSLFDVKIPDDVKIINWGTNPETEIK